MQQRTSILHSLNRLVEWIVSSVLVLISIALFVMAVTDYSADDGTVGRLIVIGVSVLLLWAAALVVLGGISLGSSASRLFRLNALGCTFALLILIGFAIYFGVLLGGAIYLVVPIAMLYNRSFHQH